jgi:CRP-like cAMP-binding protein
MQAREILKSTPFFAEVLDDAEVTTLADRAREVTYEKGARLIEEDGPGHSMFVIMDGDAVVSVHDDPEPVATLSKGAIVGEMSLLTGAPRSATVTAETKVTALEIDKAALANVLWMSPTLVARFVAMLYRRQKELDKLHGGAAWGMIRPGKAELTRLIETFYGTTG